MAKKNGHGGRRKNAGRKPKSDELKLISKLDHLIEQDKPILKLGELIKSGNVAALKLYFEYRYGKPKDSIDITSGDEPIQNFNLSNLTDKELAVILKLHNDGQNTDTDEE